MAYFKHYIPQLFLVILVAMTSSTFAAESQSMEQRRLDWRNGALTYQVFVDRFAPAEDLEGKRHLYPAPKTLRPWSELPRQEKPSDTSILWTHELAFWGGDLNSLNNRLNYIQDLGMDVIYLNPIVKAQSNHKYDASDFYQVAPEYGNLEDLQNLSNNIHNKAMHLILDGVFNHVGYQSDWFQDAKSNPDSQYRDWFVFNDQWQNNYRGWWGVANLPELNWDNPDVVETLVTGPNSVVRHYFNYGIDGWRLDVATELGFQHLKTITNTAHASKSNSLVIGEVWSYPKQWTEAMDAVMNFSLRELMFRFVENKLSGTVFGQQLRTMVEDVGIEPLLKSWLILDNHDTKRLMTLYPDPHERKQLQLLQMTLPGAPLIYYGVELGMEGGDDPENRAPMAWNKYNQANPELKWFRSLITLRKQEPALKYGDFVLLDTQSCLAFLRTTDRIEDTVLVIANNQSKATTETLMLREPRLMNGDEFESLLTKARYPSHSGAMTIKVPAQTVLVLKPRRWPEHTKKTGHSPYKNLP